MAATRKAAGKEAGGNKAPTRTSRVARSPAPLATVATKKAAKPPKAAKPMKAAKEAKPQKQEKQEKQEKPRKPKLVRDSFTIPKEEYAVIDALKQRAARLGRPAKKSEVLRAGVKALAAMGDSAYLACMGAVPSIKTGRPAKA